MTNDLIKTEQGSSILEKYAMRLQADLAVADAIQKSGFAPSHYKNPQGVLVAMWYGAEIGLSPLQSLQSIWIGPGGKPCLEANAMKALVQREGVRFEPVKWDGRVCSLKLFRDGHEYLDSYSIEEATAAGLAGKDNWKRMPKDMLFARCVSRLCRNHCADLLKGFNYTKEEMLDVTPPPQPTRIEDVVKPAEPVDHSPHWYRLKDVAPAARKKAIEYAESQGAAMIDSKELIYRSEGALKRLIAHEIEEPQIAEPVVETPLGEQIDGGAEIEGEDAA